MACWYTTAICAAVWQRATLPPLNYTQGFFFPPHYCAEMSHGTETLAQHYSECEHTVQSSKDTKLRFQQRGKEECSVTALVAIMSGRRAQPRLRLSENLRNGTPRPALPRCCFRHADNAAARTRVKHRSRHAAAAEPRPEGSSHPAPPPATPPTAGAGGGGEGRHLLPQRQGSARSPRAWLSPSLGKARAAPTAAPRSPSASAEETKVKSPLLGA